MNVISLGKESLESRNLNSQNIFFLGRKNLNPEYFLGSLDEVRIYDRALSAAEVRELYLKHLGLQTSYSLDESDPSGNTTSDLSPTLDRKGRLRGAVRISEDNDQIAFDELNATDRWTLSSWIKPKIDQNQTLRNFAFF